MTRKRIILLAVSVGVFLIVAFFGWQGARAWRGIERIEFDIDEARSRLTPLPDVEVETTPPPLEIVEYDTVLVIGNDFSPDRQEGVYADAVLFWLAPTNGGGPVLESLPRDLLVIDPCTGEETKLDRTLAGCGDNISGPEHVALAVEDYTGIAVDHFAILGLDGFVEIIDSIGGLEICV